ncbi:MAG: hypothetical protein ACLPKI_31070 [Streptosporangiaceae bacterium]
MRLGWHAPGIGLLVAVTLWTMHRFIFTEGVPAGTDMLGFISRAAQNAAPGRVVDAWSPSSFGSRRVFTFDNILGALTVLTRSPMATVKLLDVLTLFGAGLAAYALAWFWYRRRLVATTGGLLYLASQASLSRWGSGQLNVEIIISLAPVMILAWSACLQRFTLGRAVGFTFALGIGFLIRADLVLYVVPFLIIYAATVLSTREGLRAGLADTARTLAVAVPGVLLMNAAWLLPSLTGYRAQYETLNQIFSVAQLSTRSLDFYPSLLGFSREIGYFGFTGTETWYSFPGLPLWAYYAFATIIPVFAYLALRWNRDRRTIFLVLAAILATLIAPGSNAPFGSAYLWAVRTLPIVGNLRDPNRWLIVQAIGYALLASLTIEHIFMAVSGLSARHSRRSHRRGLATASACAVAFSVLGAALVPVLPTLVTGLRTWHVTGLQQALLDQVRDAHVPGAVASIPFDQDYRYLVQGSYQGYEHDLGYESALFTGRPDVGDGSWNQRSANFVAYEANLLARRDPAFAAMLASAGVSRIMSFRYPQVSPGLLSRPASPYSQQRDASRLPGLTPLLSNSAGTDYQVADAAAPLTFRPNLAVVLGGSQGIAALADRPGLKLSDWAVFTADDVVETEGFNALLALIRRADTVLLADERPVDIAVEGTTPLAKLVGITSDPQPDRLETDVPTDQSAQTGSLDDTAVPIPQPQSTSSSTTFSVSSPRQVEIWTRILVSPHAATIQAHMDGVLEGSVTPVTLGTGGFEWLCMATVHVGAGTHRITISAVPSRFGDSYEVEEARALDADSLRSVEGQLNRALAARAARVAYSFNLDEVAKWSWASLYRRLAATKAPTYSTRGWGIPRGSWTKITSTPAPGGATAPEFTAQPGRAVYAITKLNYKRPQDWADRPYIYLAFKGTDSRQRYEVIFDFGLGSNGEARYAITDDSRQWRTLAFPTADPGPRSGKPNWARLKSVRIALPSKAQSGTFAVSLPRPSKSVDRLTVPLPVLHGTRGFVTAAPRPACLGGIRSRAPHWIAAKDQLMLSVSSLRASCDIFARSQAGYHQLPAKPVRIRQTGLESWSYALATRHPGVLVWTQAYDPLWTTSGVGGRSAAIPVLSLLNGYLVGPGHHIGSIGFAGETSTMVGVGITVFATVLLLVIAGLSLRRGCAAHRTRRVGVIHGEYSDRWPLAAPLGRIPDHCLTAGVVLLALCPVASLVGLTGLLLPFGLLGILACAASAVLVATHRPIGPYAGPGPGVPSEQQDLDDAVL